MQNKRSASCDVLLCEAGPAWGVLGDADEDGTVNIKDATAIQKNIAGIDTGYDIARNLA